jgi:hypothetical protein
MTTAPLSIEVLLSEFSEDDVAWVLQDLTSGKYVTVPDPQYPGRRPVRFFMCKTDAEDVLAAILKANESLRTENISPVQVKLKPALRSLAAENRTNVADSFVVHSPNEVYEFVRDQL